MSLRLICEVNEDLRVITEATESGGKNFFIEGRFMSGAVKNKNGRVYSTELLSREVNRYTRDYINENRAYGELGHPSGPTINLERVSHMIKSLKQEGDNFIGRAKILDTPYGQIVKNLMSEGAKLGVSTRGMGSLVKKGDIMEVQDDFYLASAADIVAEPSGLSCFVNGIMEGKEWLYSNGSFKEIDLETAKKEIDAGARSRLTEETALRVMRRFFNRL